MADAAFCSPRSVLAHMNIRSLRRAILIDPGKEKEVYTATNIAYTAIFVFGIATLIYLSVESNLSEHGVVYLTIMFDIF